jgi:hypothetical protein
VCLLVAEQRCVATRGHADRRPGDLIDGLAAIVLNRAVKPTVQRGSSRIVITATLDTHPAEAPSP